MPEQRIFFSRHDSQARIPLNRRGVIATLCPFSETVLELDEQLNPSRSQFVHVPSRLSHRTYKHRVSKMREKSPQSRGDEIEPCDACIENMSPGHVSSLN